MPKSLDLRKKALVVTSWGMLITMGSGLIYIVVFLSSLNSRSDVQAGQIQEVRQEVKEAKADQKEWTKYLEKIDQRLSRIEGKLE